MKFRRSSCWLYLKNDYQPRTPRPNLRVPKGTRFQFDRNGPKAGFSKGKVRDLASTSFFAQEVLVKNQEVRTLEADWECWGGRVRSRPIKSQTHLLGQTFLLAQLEWRKAWSENVAQGEDVLANQKFPFTCRFQASLPCCPPMTLGIYRSAARSSPIVKGEH